MNFLPVTLIGTMWMSSVLLAALPYLFLSNGTLQEKIVGVAIAPVVFVLWFLFISGILSIPAQKAIIRGKFPREPNHPVYFWRKIYGCCWTTLYYFKPLYSVAISIPLLKKMTFRLFGYRGSTNFTVYPDTWIRDLPLLDIGEKSYLSNRATIGTNICLKDGTILVDQIKIGKNTMVGHLTMLAPGTRLEDNVEVGVGSAIGIRCRLGENSKVGGTCTLNHGVVIGKNVEIGTSSFVGLKAEIADGIKLPPGSNIPGGAVIRTQAEVMRYFSSENLRIGSHLNDIGSLLSLGLENTS